MSQLEIDPSAKSSQPQSAPTSLGQLSGVIAAVLALCIGEFVASLLNVVSPFGAVGGEFIDRTPKWLKELAIDWFGTNDKVALRAGMALTILSLAAFVGVAARRTQRVGFVAMFAFGLFGALVAVSRPGEGLLAVVPALLAATTGALSLRRLLDIVRRNDPADEMLGVNRKPDSPSRRQFVLTVGTAAVGAVGASVGANQINSRRDTQVQNDALKKINASSDKLGKVVSEAPPIPADSTLSPVTPFITPNTNFYRIDTAFSAPRVQLATWAVNIGGRVERPLRLTYEDLLGRPQVERIITICCVSNEVGGNLIGNAVWQGVLLADLLDEVGVKPEATQVFGTSVDGWTCGFPLQLALDGRDAMIALQMNGEKLPVNHGFPARMIVPGLYGYISATKWLTNIDLTTWDEAVGYWIPRGWSRDAPVKTQSRIDVPRKNETVSPGKIPIAGIAWAQHRGVAKVEVRVDDGQWLVARLSAEVTDDVWRQWIIEWDATPGDHIIQVRATDRNGDTQTEQVARVDPDGATGYHTRLVRVRA